MKQKTRKSIAKRFKITKTGKILRGRQYGRHLKAGKRKSRIRRLRKPAKLTGRIANKIRKLLTYG